MAVKDNDSNAEVTNEPVETSVRQQKVNAWFPILDPVWFIATLFAMGAICIPTGFKIKSISNNVVEMSQIYDSFDMDLPCKITKANENNLCSVTFTVENDMKPPIMVYYEIDNFYQNHRQYKESRDDFQLLGSLTQNQVGQRRCEPLNKLGNITLNPCGMIANTLFNDVISLQSGQDSDGENLTLIEDGIAWQSDLDYMFKQPDTFRYEECDCNDCTCDQPDWSCTNGTRYEDSITGKCYKYFYPNDDSTQYLYETYPKIINPIEGVQNEHFAVWMRVAAFPKFRKLYGYFDRSIKKGEIITFNIDANWIVHTFKGSKALVLSSSSIFGGKNPQLGNIFYIVGIIFVSIGFLFAIKQIFNPRKLGNPKYLKYKKN